MRLMRDLVGETLSGRYRLVARIAGGGMGEVYRGHDHLLDRSVAVKILQPSLASDEELVGRFRAEARAAARLSHPNVVAVHDWGCEDDRIYYMVMEYVPGTDLRDVLVGRGPLDPAHATDVVIAICDALHAAHRQGLIHRDVKPENVLIARDGTVKVADFGIAAVADAERTIPGGSILGTLRYLSPEQAAGEAATTASDIWSAGAVLFELLTGSAPQGGTGAELLRRRSIEPPVAPSTLEPSVPESLDEVVLRACAVDPQDRYEDVADMAVALRTAAVELVPVSKPVTELLVDLTEDIHLPELTPPALAGRRQSRRDARRSRTRALRGIVFVVLLAAVVFGGWRGAAALFGPKEVEVPTLVGLNRAEAAERAEGSGFDLTVTAERRDPDVEEGDVISQTPADGLLLEGEEISVVLSKGPPLVKVPDFIGMSLEKAETKLKQLGLELGTTTREFSTEFAQGEIIEQESLGKRIEQGQAVSFLVSKGPELFGVPDVVGLKQERAEAALRDAGFKVEFADVYSDEVPSGKVVSTTPGAGAEAPEASTIQVAVSIGPEFEDVKMPDVRGMHVDDARAELEGIGFTVRVSQSCPGTTVQETDPRSGTKVKENARVTLFVCG
ncbi:MAG: Stk1 family PASTA domain-containing Ser/Thr kinase [Actinomycetota bacterium]